MKNEKSEWRSANDLHEMKGTTRAWLRENWNAGNIRRREITATMHDGSVRTKYLFNVADVERLLEKTETGGEND